MARDDLGDECCIIDGGRKRTNLIKAASERHETVPTDAAICRFHTNHSAQCGWLTNRTTGVAAQADGRKTGSNRCRTSAATSTRYAGSVKWVARGAERTVLGARAHCEFIEIGFADHDSTRCIQRGDDGRVVWRLPASEHVRRACCRNTTRAHVVFDGDWNSGKHTYVVSRCDCRVNALCRVACDFSSHQVERIDIAVALCNHVQVMFDHFRGRHFFRSYRIGDTSSSRGNGCH